MKPPGVGRDLALQLTHRGLRCAGLHITLRRFTGDSATGGHTSIAIIIHKYMCFWVPSECFLGRVQADAGPASSHNTLGGARATDAEKCTHARWPAVRRAPIQVHKKRKATPHARGHHWSAIIRTQSRNGFKWRPTVVHSPIVSRVTC